MDDDGAQGAAAAAKYFLELDPYIQATGDTAEWRAMSHSDCEFCEKRRAQAAQIAERHGVFSGGETTAVVKTVYEQDAATSIWPVDVQLTVEATRLVDATGAEVFSAPRVVNLLRVEMARRNNAWVVVGVRGLD